MITASYLPFRCSSKYQQNQGFGRSSMDFTTADENQVNACQTSGENLFSRDNISTCERYVLSIQRRLDKAVANDDKTKIRWYTHLLMKRSRSIKILAVHRVRKVNTGRHTAGVDGVSIPKDIEGRFPKMMELFNGIDIERKPQPIKRIYIPKPNGGKRPLGIPTIADRINQDIIRQALEPICEYHFLTCSYGFRPKRGAKTERATYSTNYHVLDKDTGLVLHKLGSTTIKRFIKVRQDKRVYDASAREYWDAREYHNAKDMIIGKSELSKLYSEQKGRCGYCNQPFIEQQVKDCKIEKHHLKPRSFGGIKKLRNLRLLHLECHNTLHGTFSRKEMADFINKGTDYLRLMKPATQ